VTLALARNPRPQAAVNRTPAISNHIFAAFAACHIRPLFHFLFSLLSLL